MSVSFFCKHRYRGCKNNLQMERINFSESRHMAVLCTQGMYYATLLCLQVISSEINDIKLPISFNLNIDDI